MSSVAVAVVYKPNEYADEYMVFVDDVADYERWKDGAKDIALSRFIGQFSIYKSATSGHTGSLGEISKQEIENVFFGDEKNVKDKSVEAAIMIILQNGKMHKSDFRHSYKLNMNPSRGAGDTRATGASGAAMGFPR
ncbi:hypothetical protein D1P53_000854 [Cryptococcus gattii VGV]|uniref:Unplaced genomic scaffold supercont1.14, whole genome shotgun sequence n=3 Tax=Cryptococcus gattii species complex TaxID=1884637 RepID=A0A0D0VER3_CRYGA|nr:hypothetical protein D1P53_000854 [Cryptococcus gattii VGV]KIR45966.1 hypothetical protein I312_04936 [Cryptococcus bacillisporus CA1280]KIR59004.1 hypothetical protein I314_04988 [Cryptococcus bacillisporus CA1873]|eukprot:KIR59004.1 hypothetical protein I314_04988 [Cryptococcus gattii CA1873]